MKKLLIIAFVFIHFVSRAEYDSTYVLSVTQKYAIPENISNSDYVGIWKKTYTWTPVGTISYSIENNFNSAFSINSSSGLITVSDATKINGKVVQQDTLINLIIRTTDSGVGYELDTARIWVKENAYCKFIDYSYSGTESGTRTQPYNSIGDFTVAAGYGYFFKRGTSMSKNITYLTAKLATPAHPIIMGAYGTGNKPKFTGQAFSSFCFYLGSGADTYSERVESLHFYDLNFSDYYGCVIYGQRKCKDLCFYNCLFYDNVDTYSMGVISINEQTYADSLEYLNHEFIDCEFDTLDASGNATSDNAFIKIGGSPTTVTNCSFKNSSALAVRFTGGGYGDIIRYSVINGYSKRYNNCAGVQFRSNEGKVEDVRILDGGTGSIGINMTAPNTNPYSPDDNIIRNVYVDHAQNIAIRLQSDGAGVPLKRNIVEDCILTDGSTGIYISNCWDLTIRRNKIYSFSSYAVNSLVSNNDNVKINYNIIYSGSLTASAGTDYAVYNNTVDGNITLSGTSGAIVRNNYFKVLTEGSTPTKSNNLDIDTITTANHFENYAGHDYRLKSTAFSSINDGYNVSLSPDIAGTSVPQGGATDIGAYECSVPDAPTSLTSTSVTSTSVGLSWTDNSSDELKFIIERSLTAGSGFSVIDSVNSNVTTYTNTGRTPSTTYYYRVRARNASGYSGYSNELSVTTTTNLTLIKTVKVNMYKTSYPAGTGWNDFTSFSAGSSLALNDSTGTSSGYTIYNEDAWDGSYATGMTTGPYPQNVNVSNWSMISGATKDIEFRNLNNSHYYNLEFYGSRTTTGETRKIRVTIGSEYDICDVTDNTTDKAKFTSITPSSGTIRASVTVETGGYGYLNAVVLREYAPSVPQAPTSLTSPSHTSTSVGLSWTDNSSDELKFIIERSLTSGSGFSVIDSVNSNVTTYTNTGRTPSTTYYYRVRARNSSGYSSYSNELSVTTSTPSLVKTVKVNMYYTSYSGGTGWNDFSSQSAGSSLSLNDSTGTASGYTIYNEDSWPDGSNANGMTSGPYPQNVNRSHWIYASGTTKDIEFRNLNNSHYYNLEFYGSRTTTGETRKIRVTIGSEYDICDVTDNTTDKAKFTSITPSSGTIRASVTVEIGGYGYLNAIVLREYDMALKSAKISTSSISPKQSSSIIIYPNPFRDALYIKHPEYISRVELMDVSGKILFVKENLQSSGSKFNTENLKSGIYILRLFDDTGAISVHKVVK